MSDSPDTRRRLFDLAAALIAARSPNPPGDERAVAEILRAAVLDSGLQEGRVLARDTRRPNLLASLAFGPGGRHLVLCGHMDTKPVGDAHWSSDPFAARLQDDRLHGLGAVDMKGALAAIIASAARLVEDPPSAGRLTLLFCSDEENGAAYGARYVVEQGALDGVDGVIIAEPAGIHEDFDRLHLVSRGIARGRVCARGVQGHSSLRGELGLRNAGADVAAGVLAIEAQQLPLPAPPHEIAGWDMTVSAGLRYCGGVGYGVLPQGMTADCEVRLLPGVRREQIADAFDRALSTVSAARGADLVFEWDEPPTDWLPATVVAPGDPLAVAARRALSKTRGVSPTTSVFPGTTDASWLVDGGRIPVLPACGPGMLRCAHSSDEWVSADSLAQAADLYALVARSYCSG